MYIWVNKENKSNRLERKDTSLLVSKVTQWLCNYTKNQPTKATKNPIVKLKVSYFRNVFLVSSILLKNERKQFDLWYHGLWTPREEIVFTARPKIHSHSQIFRYGRSIFCLPHRPIFSGIFDLCLHWVSVVRVLYVIHTDWVFPFTPDGLFLWIPSSFVHCQLLPPLPPKKTPRRALAW